MKTLEMNVVNDNLRNTREKRRSLTPGLVTVFILSLLIFSTNRTFAHCDTMDGPLIADARKAIEQNNVNYTLKWVPALNESEISDAFKLMMKVRGSGTEAKELAEKYFFDTLVRIHRAAEGIPFTGVKPSGTPIDEKVLAADKSIEVGNLSPLKQLISKDKLPELTERFKKVMSLKNFDVNNVAQGREYIEAYVQFFKFAEGEEEHSVAEHSSIESGSNGHTSETNHSNHIPWLLSGLFFITTIVLGSLFFKKSNK